MFEMNGAEGKYSPGFFYVLLDNEMFANRYSSSVFVHEYIHFLQNVSTINGIQATRLRYLRFLKLAGLLTGVLERSAFDKEMAAFNEAQGDRDWVFSNLRAVSFERPKDESDKFVLKDVTGTGHDYCLGAYAISENMAALIHDDFLGKRNDRAFAPYSVVEEAVKKICPGIAWNTPLLVALFDASLQHSHPGFMLSKLLEWIDKYGNVSDPREIYSLLNENYSVWLPGDSYVRWKKYYAKGACSLVNEIKTLFRLEGLENLRQWIDSVFKGAIEFRNRRPTLLLDLVCEAREGKEQKLEEIINMVGCPPVFAPDHHEPQYAQPKGNWEGGSPQFAFFLGLEEALRVYTSREADTTSYPCNLRTFCEKQPGIVSGMDSACDHQPWLRAADPMLCPFAAGWASLNLPTET